MVNITLLQQSVATYDEIPRANLIPATQFLQTTAINKRRSSKTTERAQTLRAKFVFLHLLRRCDFGPATMRSRRRYSDHGDKSHWPLIARIERCAPGSELRVDPMAVDVRASKSVAMHSCGASKEICRTRLVNLNWGKYTAKQKKINPASKKSLILQTIYPILTPFFQKK